METYHVDVWGTDWERLGDDEAARLAALTYQLPKAGRVWTAIAPAASHSMETQLLREIELNQRIWHWAHTDQAKDESTAPQPITLPGEQEAHEAAVERELQNAADVAALLGINI